MEESSSSEIWSDSDTDEFSLSQSAVDTDNYFASPTEDDTCLNCISLRDEVERLEDENRDLSERNDMLKQENEQLKGLQYNYENVSQNKEHFEKSTGIALDKFHSLYKLVNPGVKCKNLKFYERHLTDAKPSSQSAQFNAMDYKCKPGPKSKFDSIDQLFMVLFG